MVSPELICRYPFFGGLTYDHKVTLANVADEYAAPAGHYFFHEGDELSHFYLTVEGQVVLVIGVPKHDVAHKVSDLLTREFETTDVIFSSVGPGDVFGWSAMVPPYSATSSGKALTSCRVIAFDCRNLRTSFEEDPGFGYLMMQKIAQVIRSRLRALRVEVLAELGT